jgi:hypothetical protein
MKTIKLYLWYAYMTIMFIFVALPLLAIFTFFRTVKHIVEVAWVVSEEIFNKIH